MRRKIRFFSLSGKIAALILSVGLVNVNAFAQADFNSNTIPASFNVLLLQTADTKNDFAVQTDFNLNTNPAFSMPPQAADVKSGSAAGDLSDSDLSVKALSAGRYINSAHRPANVFELFVSEKPAGSSAKTGFRDFVNFSVFDPTTEPSSAEEEWLPVVSEAVEPTFMGDGSAEMDSVGNETKEERPAGEGLVVNAASAGDASADANTTEDKVMDDGSVHEEPVNAPSTGDTSVHTQATSEGIAGEEKSGHEAAEAASVGNDSADTQAMGNEATDEENSVEESVKAAATEETSTEEDSAEAWITREEIPEAETLERKSAEEGSSGDESVEAVSTEEAVEEEGIIKEEAPGEEATEAESAEETAAKEKSSEEADGENAAVAESPEETAAEEESSEKADGEDAAEAESPEETAAEEESTEEADGENADGDRKIRSLRAPAADTVWQEDFLYKLETGSKKIITLRKYNGSATELRIPATAVIGGVTYHTRMGTYVPDTPTTPASPFYQTPVQSLSFEDGVTCIPNCSFMFYSLKNLTHLDLRGLDTTGVTSMRRMFRYCYSDELDFSGFDFSSVTDIREMLESNHNLKKLTVPGNIVLPQTSGYDLPEAPYHMAFHCWNTSPDGSGTNYYMGTTTGLAHPITLYAQFIPAVYGLDSLAVIFPTGEMLTGACINGNRGIPRNSWCARIPAEEYGFFTADQIPRIVTALVLKDRLGEKENCTYRKVIDYLTGRVSLEPTEAAIGPYSSDYTAEEVAFYREVLARTAELGNTRRLYVYVGIDASYQNVIAISPAYCLSIAKFLADNTDEAGKEISFQFDVWLSFGGAPLTGRFPASKTGVGETSIQLDDNGHCIVSLKPDEMIRILELPEDTAYRVAEDTSIDNGYMPAYHKDQVFFTGTIGEPGAAVTEYNTKRTGTLSLTKQVVNYTEGRPDQYTFHLKMLKNAADPLSGIFPYRILTPEDDVRDFGNARPDEEGTVTFTLAEREVYRIADIPYGTEYFFTEDEIPDCEPQTNGAHGILEAPETEAVFTNTFPSIDTSFRLAKKDSRTGRSLSGAVFGIYSDARCTGELLHVTTDASGKADFKLNVQDPVYIRELQAPRGYRLDKTVYGPYDTTDKDEISLEFTNTSRNIVPTGVPASARAPISCLVPALILLFIFRKRPPVKPEGGACE